MYQAIQPTGDQRIDIDKILEKYSRLNSEATASFRKEFKSRMGQFRNELDSILTPEQISRLKELDAQREEMIKSRRSGHGRDYNDQGRKSRCDSSGLSDTE